MTFTNINRVAHGFTGRYDSSKSAVFYGANFNMPVSSEIFNNLSYTRYYGPMTWDTETFSYDLDGFSPGFEVFVGGTIFDVENDSGSDYTIDTLLNARFTLDDHSTTMGSSWICDDYPWYQTIADSSWAEVWAAQTRGVASWEITGSGTLTYYIRSNSREAVLFSTVEDAITVVNCPSTTQLSSGTEGYIWVEGNNLAYVNANKWKHSITGTLVSTSPGTSKAGYMWIDTTDLHWVGEDGYDYKVPWKLKQFASAFTNSATGETYAGTNKAGYMWVDSEYGYTHLAYIGSDGYKYICGAGVQPF